MEKMKKKILVVDDDSTVRRALVDTLSDFFHVIEASSGEAAVKMFAEHSPHIVIMDIVMPVMSGVEVTREIKKICKKAKIIGLSAYSNTKEKDMLEAGAKEVLPKPVSFKTLLERIRWHLEHNNNCT